MTDDGRGENLAEALEARLKDRMLLASGAVALSDGAREGLLLWYERIPHELRGRGHALAEVQVEVSTRLDRVAFAVAGPTDAAHSALLAWLAGDLPDDNLTPLAEGIDSLDPAQLGLTVTADGAGIGLGWRIYHEPTMLADDLAAGLPDRRQVLGWAVRSDAQATVRLGGLLTDDPAMVHALVPVGGADCVERALSLLPALDFPFPPEAASASLLGAEAVFVRLWMGPSGVVRLGLVRAAPELDDVLRAASATGGASDRDLARFEGLLDSDGAAFLEIALTGGGWESSCIYSLPDGLAE